MKSIILIFAILFAGTVSYGQIKDDDYKKMIDTAIVMQTNGSNKTPYRPGIYLIDAKDQGYMLTSAANKKKFGYINVYDKKNKNLLKKGINAWKVLPVLSGNRLIIRVIDLNVIYRNNIYKFGNGGGAAVTFEYLCDKNKWVFKETNWSGL
ncbi:hypothetical protein [Pedobacter sp. BMA]|uniref:hypothetical protein n=1 Tax=Pedobacter sp. BMA TaxID=1663685 RepID=UPI00064AB136|nr:hypothetical protein [Pedobacter sp. BMA]KLT65387.1 hypothetical protein AB669_09855 [Pedobacter sp. BMA]